MSNAEYLKALRAEAKAKGLCGECRARPAKLGRLTCQFCLDKHDERKSAYIAVGLCPCGRETDGRFLCVKCAPAQRRGQRERYDSRKAAGMCPLCKSSPKDGCVYCPTCIARCNSYKPRAA